MEKRSASKPDDGQLIDVLREALYDTVVQLREAKMALHEIRRVAESREK